MTSGGCSTDCSSRREPALKGETQTRRTQETIAYGKDITANPHHNQVSCEIVPQERYSRGRIKDDRYLSKSRSRFRPSHVHPLRKKVFQTFPACLLHNCLEIRGDNGLAEIHSRVLTQASPKRALA